MSGGAALSRRNPGISGDWFSALTDRLGFLSVRDSRTRCAIQSVNCKKWLMVRSSSFYLPIDQFVLDAWSRHPGRAPRLGIVIIDIGNPVYRRNESVPH